LKVSQQPSGQLAGFQRNVPLPKAAEEALNSFVRFRAKLEIGLTKMDYDKGVAELNGDLEVYLSSADAQATAHLNTILSEAVYYYTVGSKFWDAKNRAKATYGNVRDKLCDIDLADQMVAVMTEANKLRPATVPNWQITGFSARIADARAGRDAFLRDYPGKVETEYTDGSSISAQSLQAAWVVAADAISKAQTIARAVHE
jgi:hypothetical protein